MMRDVKKVGVYAFWLVFYSLLSSAQVQTTEEQDAKAIAATKQMLVSKLDSTLPAIGFEKWLRTDVGADASLNWEVNDCGEQTGTAADREQDIPLCVEAAAVLKDRRSIVIMIGIGTHNKGVVGKPSIYFAQLVSPRETINLKHLSELPAALMKTRPPQ